MLKRILFLILLAFTLTGCSSSEKIVQNQPEQIAQDFFYLWATENYDLVYDLLIPELQSQRTKSEFIKFVEASQEYNMVAFKYEEIVLENERSAYANYFYYSQKELEPRNSTLELVNINGKWKINGFDQYITKTCVVDDCEEELKPGLIRGFIERCLDTGHPFSQCKYLAERDYSGLKYSCNKSTGYQCTVLE